MADPPVPPLPPDPGDLPRPLAGLDWRDRVADVRDRLDGRALLWALGAVVGLGVGWWLLRPAPAPVEETLPLAQEEAPAPAPATPSSSTTAAPGEIVVHAAGAVGRPGVYRLDPSARVDDLVRASGGLAPDADTSRLNLAAPLADGSRVYVPRSGEEVPPAVGPEGQGPSPGPDGDGPSAGPVDLNTADEEALDELPGVGPATAAAIIAFREENGGFRSVDDLLDVRGIGEAKLEQLRPLVTV